MIVQGCLAWENIEERDTTPTNTSLIPKLISTDPALSAHIVDIDKDCTGYQFAINELRDARSGDLLSRQDVFINWFFDYETNKNPQSAGMNYLINIINNTTIPSEPIGTTHVVDLRISDKDFLTEGDDVRVNWDVPEGANVEDHFWIIRVVDNNFSDPNCTGYTE